MQEVIDQSIKNIDKIGLFCTKCGWILIVTEGYLLYLSNKTRLFEHKKTIWYFS